MLELILNFVSVEELIWLVVLLPAAAASICGLVCLLVGARASEPKGLVISVSNLASILSFVIVIVLAYITYDLKSISTTSLISWKGVLWSTINMRAFIDPISIVSLFVTSFSAAVINLYAIGWFAGRSRISLHFFYFNLAVAIASLAILVDNFLFFLMTWVLLGIISAGLVGRGSEEGGGGKIALYISELISASFLLFALTGLYRASLPFGTDLDLYNFGLIARYASQFEPFAQFISLSIFAAVFVKTMQVPFEFSIAERSKSEVPVFVYLYSIFPIIISVYLMTRFEMIFYLSPFTLKAMTIAGSLSMILASARALVEDNVRKVASYLVVFSAGAVATGFGIKAFGEAVLSAVMHAAYTLPLFLALGSAILVSGVEDISRLAGLKKALPVTSFVAFVGAFSAVGIYPLAGFFSHSGLLWETYARGHIGLFLVLVGAYLLYTVAVFRLVSAVFLGRPSQYLGKGISESSASMLSSMVVATFVSVAASWISVPSEFGGEDRLKVWISEFVIRGAYVQTFFSKLALAALVAVCVLNIAIIVMIVYAYRRSQCFRIAKRFGWLRRLVLNRFYLGPLLERFCRWLVWIGRSLLLDGLEDTMVRNVFVDGLGRSVDLIGDMLWRVRPISPFMYMVFSMIVITILLAGLVF